MKRYKEQKRERYLTTEEHQRLGKALDDGRSAMPEAVNAFQLLLLTGCRLREIQRLKWEYVFLDEGIIRLPDSKMVPARFSWRECDRLAWRHHAG
ncbi:site-specific integrase [Komagataeibacter medellinensis]|uniref:hypothetical protein n=1 Tax=Komagataeibacter medellinensis TaxID=1177712 RepID=UPI001E603ACA|nr:hypothetical protein [Komagataeibacter medellinensis]